MNNNINMIGHVGQTPIAKVFPSGKKLARFSVAVKEFAANGNEPRTMWLDVQAWNAIADRVSAHVNKGREIALQGRLALNQYTDKSGRQVIKPVINLTSFHLCGRKPDADRQ